MGGNLFELRHLSGLRLLDLEFPAELAEHFPGPQFGVAPVTDRQIGWALAEGWAEVPLDTKNASLREGKMSDRLGGMLGEILRNVLQACRLRRVAVVGGDTAGEVARALRLEALQMVAPLAPGGPPLPGAEPGSGNRWYRDGVQRGTGWLRRFLHNVAGLKCETYTDISSRHQSCQWDSLVSSVAARLATYHPPERVKSRL